MKKNSAENIARTPPYSNIHFTCKCRNQGTHCHCEYHGVKLPPKFEIPKKYQGAVDYNARKAINELIDILNGRE